MLDWIKNHFNTLRDLQFNSIVTNKHGDTLSIDAGFNQYIETVKSIRQHHAKLMFIGNGGSAGIASHMATDYSKNGQLPSITFTDPSFVTCLSNDYGYEHVFSKQIEYHARAHDVLIAISSSGKSANILNAVNAARSAGCHIMTFTGFEAKNPLSQLGDVNFYVASKEYGYVEVAHLALIHSMLDYIIEEQCRHAEHHTHAKLSTVS